MYALYQKLIILKDVNEYRPISVLCILSTLFECVILTQLCNYIEVKASYTLTQSGFRKGHSTSTLLLKLRDDITRAMKTSEKTLGILLDFSKASDTIDHLTLLRKLYKMNFSAEALKLIQSYISQNNNMYKLMIRLHLPSLTTWLYHKVAYWARCFLAYTL